MAPGLGLLASLALLAFGSAAAASPMRSVDTLKAGSPGEDQLRIESTVGSFLQGHLGASYVLPRGPATPPAWCTWSVFFVYHLEMFRACTAADEAARAHTSLLQSRLEDSSTPGQ